VLRSAAGLTLKRLLITVYNDVYDEHLFVFAAGLSDEEDDDEEEDDRREEDDDDDEGDCDGYSE
jgi:hypothetical protein